MKQIFLSLCIAAFLGLPMGLGTLFAQAQKAADAKKNPAKSSKSFPYSLEEDGEGIGGREKEDTASPKQVRLFHEVLEELLTEFAYDVKAGQLTELKNLSIRKVSVSETLPRSYQSYVELLVSEKIKSNSKVKLISCLPCKTKNTRIVDDKLMITSATTNAEDMNRAASQLGIETFMDVILVYHTTHMVIAFQAFDTVTKELAWTKTYNSETIRSRYQKLAVDFSQIEKARTSDEYVPEFRYLFGFGGGSVPNVKQNVRETSVLTFQLRGTEKFDNRKSEFGLLGTFNISMSSLLSEYPSTGSTSDEEEESAETDSTDDSPSPFTKSFGLFALYSHNFLGSLESYNEMRHGVSAALGLHLAAGYLAPAARIGWDLFLGRKFSVSTNLALVSTANILIKGEFKRVAGGVGGDVVISYNL